VLECAGSNRTAHCLEFGHVASVQTEDTPAHQALPHRSVTRSPSRPELEAMSRQPSEQVAWPTPHGQ